MPEAGNATWRKSRRSAANADNCVEVAGLGAAVGVRDSKNPDAGHLTLPMPSWRLLAGRVKAGEYDL